MNIVSEKENYTHLTKPYDEKIDNIIIEESEEENEKQANKKTDKKEFANNNQVTNTKKKKSYFQIVRENLKSILTPFKNHGESRFLQEYEDTYGRTHPNFYNGTFKQAFNTAKEESKFLIIYLHSPEHISTTAFCEQVFCNENIIEFLNEFYVCYCDSIKRSSGFLLSGKFHVTTYPFLAIVTTNSSSQSQILKVFEGNFKAYQLLTGLINTLEQNSALIVPPQSAGEEDEIRSNREIREKQDREYRESVAKDEERMKIEKEKKRIEKEKRDLSLELERLEKERQLEIEKKKIEKKERQKRVMEDKRRNLKPEPNYKTEEGVIRLRVVFPDGEKLSRSFKKQWEMKNLFDLVDIQENNSIKPEKYYFVKNYPKTSFSVKNITFENAGIQDGDTLMVIKK
ncbi:fas-associated protein [Anaeramoeba flamelloides]|uniref:Fas-associated protein n=1 Tax=Anaeramoeba flamelloides TaxID=1746091 RepID=A0ABQ8ZCP5_9EUKA|nr:fas-associated protein [Anaeramoeba flamelloides]